MKTLVGVCPACGQIATVLEVNRAFFVEKHERRMAYDHPELGDIEVGYDCEYPRSGQKFTGKLVELPHAAAR